MDCQERNTQKLYNSFMETIKIDFSNRLVGLLIEKSITQKELAKACNLSTQCVSALITGRNSPTGTTVATLAKYFGVSSDYLLGLEDDFGAPTAAAMGDSMTADERELLRCFRELSPYLKGVALDTVRGWADKEGGGSLHKKA